MNLCKAERDFQQAINFAVFINYLSQSEQTVTRTGIDVYNARINFERFICFEPELMLNMTLKRCNIKKVPRDFYMQFPNLETIDLSDNVLDVIDFMIPDRVTSINIKGNPATCVNLDIPNSVEYIMHNIQGLVLRKRDGTIVETVRPVVNVAARVAAGPRVLDTGTGVHDTNIVQSVMKSIAFLMGTLKDARSNMPVDYNYEQFFYGLLPKENYIHDDSGKLHAIFNFIKTSSTAIVYSYEPYLVTYMKNILERVIAFANMTYRKGTDESKNTAVNIITLLHIQLMEAFHGNAGMAFCHVGKYSRIVNSLASFCDQITVDLSDDNKIANKIDQLKARKLSKQQLMEQLTIFMNDNGISDAEREPWINALNDE